MAQDGRTIYRIVAGAIGTDWSDWLGAMSLQSANGPDERPATVLTGSVPDQSALRGIFNKLWDLNLTLVSVNRVEKDPSFQEANQ
jgi:hypothetical protein